MRKHQFLQGPLPDLDLTHSPGLPPRNRQKSTVRREGHGLDSLGQTNQPRHGFSTFRFPDQSFVKTGYGKVLSIRRKINRTNHRRGFVSGWILFGKERFRALWGVIERSLTDPLLHLLELKGMK